MSKQIVDAQITLFDPGETSAYQTIPGADIELVTITERAQGEIDQATVELPNDDGTYDSLDATSGDRIEFDTQLEGESSLTHRWTGVLRPPAHTLIGGRRRRITLPARDFVFTILSWRQAYREFEDTQIAGSSSSIVDTLVADEASEIGTGQIATVDETTDAFINGRDLRSVIVEDLAPIGDAIVSQDDQDLVFEPLGEIAVTHALTPDDFEGEISVTGSDDDLATLVRVDGGTDHAVDDEQTTQDSTTTITESSRIQTQIDTRKSEVDRVQIYTVKDTNSDDDLIVRLQADDSGSPVNVGDRSSDIVNKTLAPEFLDDDGFTTFILPRHTLPPKENPWLIVEASGSTGHDVGTDSSGNLTYKAEYPFPLLTRAANKAAADEYRRRDRRISDESLETEASVRDLAQSTVSHNAKPARRISGAARTNRAHTLKPGEAVNTTPGDWQGAPVTGNYLCTERVTTYDGQSTRLSTELTLQEAATI